MSKATLGALPQGMQANEWAVTVRPDGLALYRLTAGPGIAGVVSPAGMAREFAIPPQDQELADAAAAFPVHPEHPGQGGSCAVCEAGFSALTDRFRLAAQGR